MKTLHTEIAARTFEAFQMLFGHIRILCITGGLAAEQFITLSKRAECVVLGVGDFDGFP
jgi:hypothetical protein